MNGYIDEKSIIPLYDVKRQLARKPPNVEGEEVPVSRSQ